MIEDREFMEKMRSRITEIKKQVPVPVVVDKEALRANLVVAFEIKRSRPPLVEALTDREKALLGAIADVLKLSQPQKLALAKAALDNIKGSKP